MPQYIQPLNPQLMQALLQAQAQKSARPGQTAAAIGEAVKKVVDNFYAEKEKKALEAVKMIQAKKEFDQKEGMMRMQQEKQEAEIQEKFKFSPGQLPEGAMLPTMREFPGGSISPEQLSVSQLKAPEGFEKTIGSLAKYGKFVQPRGKEFKPELGITAGTASQVHTRYPSMTENEIKSLSEKSGLELIKEQGRTERAVKSEDEVTDEMASLYAPRLGMNNDEIKGMGKKNLFRMIYAKTFRPESQFEVIKNELGIPTSIQTMDQYGKPSIITVPQNEKSSQMIRDIEKVKGLSDEVFGLAFELGPSSIALVQRLKGKALEYANVIGLGGEMAQKVGILKTKAEGLSSIISKGALAETGVLTDQDVRRALSLLGKPTHTPFELEELKKGLDRVVEIGKEAALKATVPVFAKQKGTEPKKGQPKKQAENKIDKALDDIFK